MTTSCWLLLVMGWLGAADILFFHTRLHRLRAQPSAVGELVTHSLRGPTYALLFAIVPNFELRGAWFDASMVVLGFDLAISVADFWIEPTSRRPLGGLPRGEYLLHVALAMLFGALVVTMIQAGAPLRAEATELRWVEAGPPLLLRVALAVMAPAVLWSGIEDALAVVRLRRQRR